MNIFSEILHAIYSFKSYPEFLKNSRLKVYLYGLVLSIFSIMITIVLPMASTFSISGGVQSFITMFVPEFTLTDGTLWVEKPIEFKMYDDYQGGIYVKIDTSIPVVDEVTDVDLLAFDRVVMLDAQKILLKEDGDVYRIALSELELGDWNRDTAFKELFPYIKSGLKTLCVILAVVEVAGFFAGALVIAMLGMLSASALKYKISFGGLYKMAIYTRTLPVLLKMVSAWVPVLLPVYMAANFAISAFYMWKALRVLKNQQMEERAGFDWTGEP